MNEPTPLPDDEATELVMRLMAIPGRSGEEAAVLNAIVDELHDAGIKPSAIKFDNANKQSVHRIADRNGVPNIDYGQTGNLIVQLPGQGTKAKAPRRMLSAHADTVPICIGCEPKLDGDRIVSADATTGLGGDDRAGCAIVLSTALTLLRSEADHPPLTLLWTVQEEVGLHGARHLATDLLGDPKLAFNFDGGSPAKLTIGATGGYRMGIEVTGIASHAGNAPERGVSAITIAALAITDMVAGGWHGLVEQGDQRGASNVGVIQGGEATNVVTDRVTLRAEARSHDPKFRDKIIEAIEKAFARAAESITNDRGECGEAAFSGTLDYEAFRLPEDDPSVVAAAAALRALGHEPTLAVTNGGIDANWLTAHGVPTITLGCGQRNIHMAGEELDLAEFHLARRLAMQLATGG